MTAQLYNIRDYQSKEAAEKAQQALEAHLKAQMVAIASQAFPSVFGFADEYTAPEKDPA